MTIDEQVDKLLPKIDHIPKHFWVIHQSAFGKTDDDNNEIQFLYNYMRNEKRLIEPETKEEYVVLTSFGYKVLTEHNGWLAFLKIKSDNTSQFNITVDKSVTQKVKIKDSAIHGGVTQSSDSSDKKKNSAPVKAATNTTKKIIIGLLIGVGGGVAAGLILYYGFGIGE